jgi:hypothetical protein
MSEFGGTHTVQRIVVLGAGFAGLWAAIGTARVLIEELQDIVESDRYAAR